MIKKHRIIIVAPYPQGEAPSQRFRFEQYLDFLGSKDFEFSYASFWSDKAWQKIYQKGNFTIKLFETIKGIFKRFLLLLSLKKFDVILLHREALPIGPPIWEWIAARLLRKNIIYDFDDAIWLPNNSEANKKLVGKLKNHSKTAKIISWSKTIFAGNDFLAKYASNFNGQVTVVPTTIDTEKHHKHLKNHSNEGVVTIGWTGTHSTLKQLMPVFPILEEVYKKAPFKFLLISNIPPVEMPHFAEFKKWEKETEITDLLKIDIGIMPLLNTNWEKGKCGFKALQYMALGIPPVISAVGVNVAIVEDGKNGFLIPSGNNQSWQYHLLKLIKDPNLRNTLGRNARQSIENSYSTIVWNEIYLKEFSLICR